MDYKQLTRPFGKDQIKIRQGRKNMSYYYVPSQHVVERLNEIGTFNWHFTIKESKQINEEVVVLGSLTIMGNTKEAYGSAPIDDKKSVGDSFKTASALALTKAASLFGIPCVFHTKIQDNKQNTHNYPQMPTSQTNNAQPNACMDCGLIISEAEVQFSKKYAHTYKNKILCKECQQNYRNVRRVK
ncbi:Rad52/22 family double-strand break repair protein [Aneurinibacillus thermoaerophilus]|uniref:Rad52/22 family double-strand break repair protein n=1 Tax=Aneurinibacillus thermoaerophilus TaxID=143495 RepID=A0A1G7WQN8_ANETH|nr:Rad52/Rad22 family DNA repair protein [Aneurinibacillus thermoaerophilus]SDG74271.1 Rad52/22 family double-strand break repair protein [Aneurinibacillus thermoaerophilus]